MSVVEEVVTPEVATPEKVLEFLEKMGETRREVAGWVQRAGIKGIVCDTQECVIARALKWRFGGEWSVGGWALNGGGWKANVPAQVLDFIGDFDNLQYPDLVESM